MKKTYNIMEFAELMGVSVKTLRRLNKSGDLVADRTFNNRYEYTEKHIEMFEQSRQKYLDKSRKKRKSYPKNLIGQRFGKLVVIAEAEPNISPKGYRRVQWLCECDCGNTCKVMDNSLKAGYTKSCGCLLHGDNETKQMWSEFDELFEEDALAILSKRDDINANPVGITKSKRPGGGVLQDLTGQTFGFWTVLERGETRYYKGGGQAVCWVCQCVCGSLKTVPGRDLKSGASQSCGCMSSMSWLEYYTKQYLLEHNIVFEVQKSYSDLLGVNGCKLFYDFLVFKDGNPLCLIECQGEQHYRPIKRFGGAKQLLKQVTHDKLKKEYAENVLNIPLYEVLYTSMTKNDVYKDLDKFELK